MTTPEPTDQLDRISITGITGIGYHGVLASERREGQEFVVDVACGVLRPEHSDQLRTTVNYAELATSIVDDIQREPVNLIETLAERVAITCLDRPMVQRVGVRVHKPHAPIPVPFSDVTVEIERHRPRVRAVLSLGSNLDDPLAHLTGAVTRLRRSFGVDVVSVSPVYRTEPVEVRNQPDFLNIAVLVDTELSPEALLTTCHDIELAHERQRGVPKGPRTLDIDIITVGDELRDDPHLTLPHPRAKERAFVLVPWLDLDPEAELPGVGSVQDLLGSVGRRGVHPTAWRVDSDGML